MVTSHDYYRATRHPWPCFLFLLPLLVIYEMGIVWFGGGQPDALRNGADTWIRQGLTFAGMRQLFWAPLVLLLILVIWTSQRWRSRPRDLVNVLSGMGLESVGFALGLWCVGRGLGPIIDHLGVELSLAPEQRETLRHVITFVGAGIYEELIFRLFAFTGLLITLRWLGVSGFLAVALAALVSALVFSGAHHVGPHGEDFDGYTFLFRTLAGLYFAFVYQGRGLGVAVGAHACYDVIVGVTLP